MMWTRTKAERIRALLERAVSVSPLTDAEASEMPTMFPAWDKLPAGHEFTAEDVENRVRIERGGKLYVVTQPHKVQADWTPETAVSLYEYVPYRNGYREIGEYITAAHPFSKGEEGIDSDGIVWISLYDNNVYTPAQHAANWERKNDA